MREDIKKTEIKLFQDGIGGITIDLERIGNLTLSLHRQLVISGGE